MSLLKILFFGSTADSIIVLNQLFNTHSTTYNLSICAVVTQPPRPVGRKQIVTPTPVETWAKEHAIAVLSFPTNPDNPTHYQNEQTVADTLSPFKADLLVSASYGQIIPFQSIKEAKFGGLNVHPSILPRWRGADPVPWAILSGDHQTGATIVTLSEKFDEGKILAQKKVTISSRDETDALRATLFTVGAELLVDTIPDFITGNNKGTIQNKASATYARRLTRQDGFIPWDIIQRAMLAKDVEPTLRPAMLALDRSHVSITIANAVRAFKPWPGVWTMIDPTNIAHPTNTQRLKILSCHVELATNVLTLDSVQIEGKKPIDWRLFTSSHKITSS